MINETVDMLNIQGCFAGKTFNIFFKARFGTSFSVMMRVKIRVRNRKLAVKYVDVCRF